MQDFVCEFIFLTCDTLLFALCYAQHKKKCQEIEAIGSAENLKINTDLPKILRRNNNCIPYAVICGTVKATSSHLISQYLPHLRGVIREKVTKERKIRWSPMMRMWTTTDEDIQRSLNFVPFTLYENVSLVKSHVHIVDPSLASELNLPTVYDNFISHGDTVGQLVASWFRGERTTGIHELENMLTEGTKLTGIGELVLEDGLIKLKPPASETFYLTQLTVDSLLKKLRQDDRFFKVLCVMFGSLALLVLGSLLRRFYRFRKLRRIQNERNRRRNVDVIERRRNAVESGDSSNNNAPTCIVCVTNSVETVILECGHACLCLDCSQQINDYCPICRSPIDRVVIAYLP